MFDNGSEFEKYFPPLLKDFDIKPVSRKIKTPQPNAPVERVRQVILNMLVTKDFDKKVLDHVDPWNETLSYIARAIRASYRRTLTAKPGQSIFGRGMLLKLASVADWKFVTSASQEKSDIDNVQENDRRFTHDYEIGDQFYVEMTGIYRKLDYKKQNTVYNHRSLYKWYSPSPTGTSK